jgi:hypothetical protein
MLIAALFVWLVLLPLAAYQVVLNRRLRAAREDDSQ